MRETTSARGGNADVTGAAPLPDGQPGRRLRHETLVPARMVPAAKESLTRELYAAHCRIFSGVSPDRFAAHVVDPPAERTVIRLYRGKRGDIVGYCAFHRFRRVLAGRRTAVLRVEAGLLPEYRGVGAAHMFGMVRALKEKLRHPFSPVIYLGTLVHPSSYRFFCKYFPQVFPRRDDPDLAGHEALALEVIDTFSDPPFDPAEPLVRSVGWVTIEEAEPGHRLPRRVSRDVLFYKARNPDYAAGNGLVVLVPVSFFNIGTAILRRLREILAGKLGRHRGPV